MTKYSDILICIMGNCDSNVEIKESNFPINNGISLINTDERYIHIYYVLQRIEL